MVRASLRTNGKDARGTLPRLEVASRRQQQRNCGLIGKEGGHRVSALPAQERMASDLVPYGFSNSEGEAWLMDEAKFC